MSLRLPPALRPGDRIGVSAPAGPVRRDALEAGLAYLRARGFEPVLGDHIDGRLGYLAGTDADRMADLNALLAHPDLRAIWFARGGYGSGRIIDRLDLKPLLAHPKALIGYSDLTVVMAAARHVAGIVTYYGPMVSDLGDRSRFDEASLWVALSGGGGNIEHRFAAGSVLRPGRGEGPLVGGCLSLLVSLLGTPWEIDTDGAILFWEEVNEEPFRIDRMLGHLRHAGRLERLKGMVVGRLVGCEPRDPAAALSIADILQAQLRGTDYPVLIDLPAGHADGKITLPLGWTARLAADPPGLTLIPGVSGP